MRHRAVVQIIATAIVQHVNTARSLPIYRTVCADMVIAIAVLVGRYCVAADNCCIVAVGVAVCSVYKVITAAVAHRFNGCSINGGGTIDFIGAIFIVIPCGVGIDRFGRAATDWCCGSVRTRLGGTEVVLAVFVHTQGIAAGINGLSKAVLFSRRRGGVVQCK